MSIDELNLALLIGATVLIAAIIAVRLSARTNFPTLLLYLGLGLLIGEDALGVELLITEEQHPVLEQQGADLGHQFR